MELPGKRGATPSSSVSPFDLLKFNLIIICKCRMYHWEEIRGIGGRATNFHILERKWGRDIGENVAEKKKHV